MEISEQELRRLVREVDDQHRAGMETLDDDLAALHASGPARSGPAVDAGSSRRRFLQRAALGGVTLAIGTASVSLVDLLEATPAGAADAVPTDAQLVAFAESVELALVQAYGSAGNMTIVGSPAVKTLLTTFAGHHQQHADAFAALGTRLNANSNHRPNPKLLSVASGQFTAARDLPRVLEIGGLLENAAAATYLLALGILKQAEAQKLSASILPVESQHCAAFGVAAGAATGDFVPNFLTPDNAIDPAKYPV
jgi:hypothetical protein